MNLNFRNYDETKYVPRFQEGGQMPAALLQLAQGGAPAEEAPAEAPVYKMGGKLSRRIKK